MAIGPTAGSKLYIGTSETIASPDDYLEIGNITNIGDFGKAFQEITVETIGQRGVQKFKGTYNEGTFTCTVARDATDTGQAAAIAALASDLPYNFKLVMNDATVTLTTPTQFVFTAKIMSYVTKMGGANNVPMADIVISIVSGSVTETVVH